ncbi:MAG: 3-oxoacyl-[acyl-carrier-protein] synthase III C-terminal domain-containing protein [Cyanobacteriota bacterium]|nr:3-oxoacyl-[acyl-carrier-protein] synthase III C-terminal domain-containing protein [Cyanobacteriota bacterium]
MNSVYINSIGKFLPGEPIDNKSMEDYLGKIGGSPSKVRRKILKSNGIQQRYYAIDRQQKTQYQNSQMAAYAARDALFRGNFDAKAVDLLACGTTLPDLLIPGFASIVHGELSELPPLEIVSTQGVCCSGVAALNYANARVKLGERKNAIAVSSELASRLFKHTHFEAEERYKNGEKLPFDTEFLRWMLSDGAGAFLIQDRPNSAGISLKVEWIELISHANAYPLCMYAGTEDETGAKSWLDYSSYSEAAAAGAMNLRQNIRKLDDVIKLGVEGWLRLIEAGRVIPQEIDWLLCHYSSHFFRGKIVELLEKANCAIPQEKWFTNLYRRGNTGCASIYLMLEELFYSGKLQPGQQIFCFIPESGRYTTAYMMLTVVQKDADDRINLEQTQRSDILGVGVAQNSPRSRPFPLNQINCTDNNKGTADLLRQLALVWLEFERKLHSVPIIRKLNRGEFTLNDYKALLRNLRPQVVEGARWIARAASNMTDFKLRSTLIGHAGDEHRDFQMLERNYVSVGGSLEEIVNAEKNIGSEALSAFIFNRASRENPVDLIGSMFIVEGLGNQLASQWATQIQQTLNLANEQVSFFSYHGENDESHIGKLEAIVNAEWMTPEIAKAIVKTAQITARLYLLQLEEIKL